MPIFSAASYSRLIEKTEGPAAPFSQRSRARSLSLSRPCSYVHRRRTDSRQPPPCRPPPPRCPACDGQAAALSSAAAPSSAGLRRAATRVAAAAAARPRALRALATAAHPPLGQAPWPPAAGGGGGGGGHSNSTAAQALGRALAPDITVPRLSLSAGATSLSTRVLLCAMDQELQLWLLLRNAH
jgi:hypothetical protein